MRKLLIKTLELLPDKTFLKVKFFLKMHKRLNLKNPKTFNEKLQWLKLNDKNPSYTTMVDKFAVKKYVADIIGEEHIIPTLGVWDSFDEIDFDSLPNQFVLKCTHDSGGLVIVKDKSTLDKEKARAKINECLKVNYFKSSREWPYKNVPRKIIAEKYIDLPDDAAEYKMFCSYGKMNWVMVCTGNIAYNNRSNDGYDGDFNHLPISFTYPNSKTEVKKPAVWDKLLEIAYKLSKDIPQVRVDTYVVGDKIYFGELTFYHCSGHCPFNPPEWDLKFGEQIDLSRVKEKN